MSVGCHLALRRGLVLGGALTFSLTGMRSAFSTLYPMLWIVPTMQLWNWSMRRRTTVTVR